MSAAISGAPAKTARAMRVNRIFGGIMLSPFVLVILMRETRTLLKGT
jgi:hypothetical protein